MRQPARTKGRRSAVSASVSRSAPVGGWNARDSLASMPESDAVTLLNFYPGTTECILRKGYTEWATGLPAQVETLMIYDGGAVSKMWAISGGDVFDVTSTGPVGAAVVTSLGNSRWQYCNVATAGGVFMYAGNGVDKPLFYDGAAWVSVDGVSTPAITGVTTTALNSPIVFKERVFFIEVDTLKTWYLPTDAIGGAANAVDMRSVAQLGGSIQAHATWTIDAGYGVDDYYVCVTTKGEVIVYQGTDPSDATKWALKGVWRIGAPIGDRCLNKLGGDLLIVCQDGLLPLSAALQSSRVNPRVALTDKIQSAVSEAVGNYGSTFGWETFYYPGTNQLWLNVPVAVGLQEQYAMNTITKAWAQYQGYDANCFALFGDEPYYGGNTVVCKAWSGTSDNGENINAVGLPAFSDYGNAGNLKRFSMIRPILRATNVPLVSGSMNIDFNTDYSNNTLTYGAVAPAIWDSSDWDDALWTTPLTVYQNWQSVSGFGYYGSPQINVSSNNIDLRWVSTDVVYEMGAIL